MATTGLILVFAGILVYLAGLIGVVIEAFAWNIWCGLAVLLLPPLTLVFAILHWDKARGACLAVGVGLVAACAGIALTASASAS
jgi:hypothetical protein